MKKLVYSEEKNNDFVTLAEGAELSGVSYSRFRKTLQRLKINVTRAGWAVLVPRTSITRVKRAIRDGEIKRGRPRLIKKRAVLVRSAAP